MAETPIFFRPCGLELASSQSNSGLFVIFVDSITTFKIGFLKVSWCRCDGA